MSIPRKAERKNISLYAGTFLIAFTTLAVEITFSRLLSVIAYYHMAFFAVSTAMLGMTAGALTLYFKPDWVTPLNFRNNLGKMGLVYALSIPVSVLMICLLPFSGDLSLMKCLALFATTIACSLPFYFSGILITGLLTKTGLPVNKVYSSDLVGAAFGCLFVIGGLDLFDAPALIIFTGAIAVVAAALLGGRLFFKGHRIKILSLFVLLLCCSSINFFTHNGIRPITVRGKIEETNNYVYEKWNSYSKVAVFPESYGQPQLNGSSPVAPVDAVDQWVHQYKMTIDGDAATIVRRFSSLKDIGHLKYDIVNTAWYLRPGGRACVIGVGGGKDIQAAILFGSKKITGVDVNPIFIKLLQSKFRSFAGIADHEGVRLVNDEARSYLSGIRDSFDLVQMSLVDTWASTGAGAFSLSENSLYTVEAWQVFISRLSDHGLFTVSRWYNPANLGETGRIVSLACSSLFRAGIANPREHLALISVNNIATLILSRQPFSPGEIATLRSVADSLKYQTSILPDVLPENQLLRQMLSASSTDALEQVTKHQSLNFEAPTDENPYFFNMLKINHIGSANQFKEGVVKGNLSATITLLALMICLSTLTLLTIALPLLTRGRETVHSPGSARALFRAGALYFSLIGAGFMLVEIGLIQKLSVFLGHPVYALGILLFTMILSSGIGSFFSTRIVAYPLVAAIGILLVKFAVDRLLSGMINAPLFYKIIASIVLVFPLGFVLGLFFPTGMQLVKRERGAADIAPAGEQLGERGEPGESGRLSKDTTVWFWALNGIFGVLCSSLAVFISIFAGIAFNFYLAAICYGALVLILPVLKRK